MSPDDENYLLQNIVKIPVETCFNTLYSGYSSFGFCFINVGKRVICADSISSWVEGSFFAGECGLHCRNDGLLRCIYNFAGLSFGSRDNHEMSTFNQLRSDVTLGKNGIPLINVEEKENSVECAIEDLKRKFQWIPHFHRLPFIFGLAITKTEFCVLEMRHDGNHIVRFRRDISNIDGRIHCVIVAVNIARVLQHFIANNLFLSSSLDFNVWHQQIDKKIRLGFQFVEVMYDNQNIYKRMKYFYEVTKAVQNIEKCVNFNDNKLTFHLSPVGITVAPEYIHEEEIRVAVCSIARAVLGLHDKGLLHCDIRWANIISLHNGTWVLIDCTEYCTKDPSDKKLRQSKAVKMRCKPEMIEEWSVKADFYQLSKLIPQGNTLCDDLKDLLLKGNTANLKRALNS